MVGGPGHGAQCKCCIPSSPFTIYNSASYSSPDFCLLHFFVSCGFFARWRHKGVSVGYMKGHRLAEKRLEILQQGGIIPSHEFLP